MSMTVSSSSSTPCTEPKFSAEHGARPQRSHNYQLRATDPDQPGTGKNEMNWGCGPGAQKWLQVQPTFPMVEPSPA